MTKQDLQLTSTDDLVGELCNRFEELVIYAVKTYTDKDDSHYWHYIGRRSTCLGLTIMMEDKLRKLLSEENKGKPVEE